MFSLTTTLLMCSPDQTANVHADLGYHCFAYMFKAADMLSSIRS